MLQQFAATARGNDNFTQAGGTAFETDDYPGFGDHHFFRYVTDIRNDDRNREFLPCDKPEVPLPACCCGVGNACQLECSSGEGFLRSGVEYNTFEGGVDQRLGLLSGCGKGHD